MTNPKPRPDEGEPFPRQNDRDPEARLGGADAVEKTTYVVGSGTNPTDRAKQDQPSAQTPAGRSALLLWVLVVAAIVAVVYLAGAFG